MKNINLEPNMELIRTNDFYLFYEMMTQSLKTDKAKEGIQTSFRLLREFLQSGHISLYKKNKEGQYVIRTCDSPMGGLLIPTTRTINRMQDLFESNEFFSFDLNLCEELKDMILIHTKIENSDCVISIINYDKEKQMDTIFWERLRETIEIILKRVSSYEKNMSAITTDMLTNLDNRNSYVMRLQKLNESDENLVIGLFDLFRLKYINDNYGHVVGDEYIKKVADILSKYWPKNKIHINEDGTESYLDTGHCVYRIGGDEFVLLTNADNLQYTQAKANLVSLEVEKLKLMNGEQPIIGVNYGIVQHEPNETIQQTISKADKLLAEDKKKMYLKYDIERRI